MNEIQRTNLVYELKQKKERERLQKQADRVQTETEMMKGFREFLQGVMYVLFFIGNVLLFIGICVSILFGIKVLDEAVSVFHEFEGLFIIYSSIQISFLYAITMRLTKLCQKPDDRKSG